MVSPSNDFIELIKRNRAVDTNPPHGLDIHLTDHGSSWLWAVFALFVLLTLMYAGLYFFYEFTESTQLMRYTMAAPFLICLIQTFHYFTYASNLGWTGIQAEFRNEDVRDNRSGLYPNVRQIFYAKYVAWFLCWPILLFLIELSGSTINRINQTYFYSWFNLIHSLLIQIICFEYWIISLLVGSLIHSSYKWGYWVMGIFVLLFVLVFQFKRQVFDLKVRGVTLGMYCVAIIVILLYNVNWGLSDGGNAITPTAEAVFYGVLDICIFVIWAGYLTFVVSRFGEWPEIETGFVPVQQTTTGPVAPLPLAKEVSPDEVRPSGETAFEPDTTTEEEEDITEESDTVRRTGDVQQPTTPRTATTTNRGPNATTNTPAAAANKAVDESSSFADTASTPRA